MTATFSAGEKVRVKGDTRTMAVVSEEDDQTTCFWVDDNGNSRQESFPTVVLERYNPFGTRIVR